MRTMMKRRGISAALVAVVLVLAALIIGCSTPESSGGGGGEGEQYPEGMGGVKISFNDKVEVGQRQTILPPSANLSSFAGGFDLIFTPNGGAVLPAVFIPQGGPYPSVPLTAGNYSLQVLAYLGPAIQTNPAASYDRPSVDVVAGQTVNVAITLTAIDDGGDGTFAWSITSQITPSLVSSATITITPVSGAVIIPSENLIGAFQSDPPPTPISGQKSLNSGYYYVDIELIASGKTSSFRHVLHVYRNMTSTFSYTFTNVHINIGQAKITPTPIYTHPIDHAPIFTVNTGTLKSLTGTGVVTTSPSVNDPYKLSISNTTNPNIIKITVTNAGDFDDDSLVGILGGTPIAETTSGSGIINVTASTVVGFPQQFTVIGTIDGIPYSSAEIFIIVVND